MTHPRAVVGARRRHLRRTVRRITCHMTRARVRSSHTRASALAASSGRTCPYCHSVTHAGCATKSATSEAKLGRTRNQHSARLSRQPIGRLQQCHGRHRRARQQVSSRKPERGAGDRGTVDRQRFPAMDSCLAGGSSSGTSSPASSCRSEGMHRRRPRPAGAAHRAVDQHRAARITSRQRLLRHPASMADIPPPGGGRMRVGHRDTDGTSKAAGLMAHAIFADQRLAALHDVFEGER